MSLLINFPKSMTIYSSHKKIAMFQQSSGTYDVWGDLVTICLEYLYD